MRQDTITRELREDFTDADKLEMGTSLAEKLVAIATVEAEKKSADSVFNKRRAELEAEVESVAARYNKGYEMAQIGCDIRYNDPSPGQKTFYRMDTAALVETVEMSWEEKQEELQFNLTPSPDPSAIAPDDAARAELDRMAELPSEPPPPIDEQPPTEGEATA